MALNKQEADKVIPSANYPKKFMVSTGEDFFRNGDDNKIVYFDSQEEAALAITQNRENSGRNSNS